MEKQMTKAEKLLVKAVAACGDNESLLVVYSGEKEGDFAFTGDPNEIAVGFAHIMANGLKGGASDNERNMANSLLNGFYKVLAEGDKIATSLAKAIEIVVRDAKEEVAKRNAEKCNNHKHKSTPDEFNPSSVECLLCEDFKDCALLWLKDRVRDAHNARNNEKKTKKAHNKSKNNKKG